jgi:hypothetical protein
VTELVPHPISARRAIVVRLLALAVAVALGLLLQRLLAERLEAIQSLARDDVVAARAKLATLFRVGGSALFGMTGAVGMALVQASRRAIRLEQFPPPGSWSLPPARRVTGPRARRLALVSLALAAVLVLASAAGAALSWSMAARLLACRAP